MEDHIISEFRVIETDDGFRIEIKGDKEKIRPFLTGEAGSGVMPFWHMRGGRWPGYKFFFPFHFRRWMGPWWGDWGDPEQGEGGPGSKPRVD